MIDLKELESKRQGVFGMMAGSTHPRTGKLITAEKETLRLIELVNDYGDVIERLEAAENRVAELEADSHNYAKLAGANAARAQKAEAQLAELAAQEPVGEVILGDYDDCGDYPDAKAVCIAADGQADWRNFRNGTKLFAAPVAQPVQMLDAATAIRACLDEFPESVHDIVEECAAIAENAYSAAMLQTGNYPVIPDGWVMVQKRLTAENGAKSAMLGEFSETKVINCPECFGDEDCEICDGSGRIEITMPVSWTNIKVIWEKGVEHFAAAPQQNRLIRYSS